MSCEKKGEKLPDIIFPLLSSLPQIATVIHPSGKHTSPNTKTRLYSQSINLCKKNAKTYNKDGGKFKCRKRK